jgi:hypothetical protein
MDATADLARAAALRLPDQARAFPAGDAAAWWWSAGPAGCLTRTSGSVLELALVIDDRTGQLAGKEQAADGWREWLRISNALNLREQPTAITTVSVAIAEGIGGQAKSGTVPEKWCPGARWLAGTLRPGHERPGAELPRTADAAGAARGTAADDWACRGA